MLNYPLQSSLSTSSPARTLIIRPLLILQVSIIHSPTSNIDLSLSPTTGGSAEVSSRHQAVSTRYVTILSLPPETLPRFIVHAPYVISTFSHPHTCGPKAYRYDYLQRISPLMSSRPWCTRHSPLLLTPSIQHRSTHSARSRLHPPLNPINSRVCCVSWFAGEGESSPSCVSSLLLRVTRYPSRAIVICHRIPFDIQFLDAEEIFYS